MNVFIYDGFLDKYKKTVRKIEETLNQLKLQGKILYLKNLKDVKSSIESEIEMGAKTIIAVGDNKTVNTIISILANISEKIPTAIIPVGPNNSIAGSLGINNHKEACYILSSRRIEEIKIGEASGNLFIKQAQIKNSHSVFKIDNSYNLSPQARGLSTIFNLPPKKPLVFSHIQINPQDNSLNLYIETKKKNKTHLLAKKIEVLNDKYKLILDDNTEIACPATITVSGKSILFIVGKERRF